MQIEFVLLILSLLFFISIIADKIGYKFGVPALLLFLVVGMLFGSDGVGALFGGNGIEIKTSSAQALSTLALCIILFSGGLDTKINDIKSVLGPGITLATVGVMLTCIITGVIIYYIFGWLNAVASVSIWLALLMAATLSSTDSASVFSIMRTNGIGLKHNLRPLLELESGANDPMAYVLTTTLNVLCRKDSFECKRNFKNTVDVLLNFAQKFGILFFKADKVAHCKNIVCVYIDSDCFCNAGSPFNSFKDFFV